MSHNNHNGSWAFTLTMLTIPLIVFVSIWIVNKILKSDKPLTEEEEWDARNG